MTDSCCIILSAACARRVLTSSKRRIKFFTDSYLTPPPLHGCTSALTRAERANELENEHHLANAS